MASTTVRYSDEDLQEFKELILEKIEKAHQEVTFIREQMMETHENSSNQQSGDWTDESSSHTEMEMLNNRLARQQQFIRNLENALIRIHNKTYGICSISGQLIDKQRLRLVPHATKSVEAKNARPQFTAATTTGTEAPRPRTEEDAAPETEPEGNIEAGYFDNE